MKQVRNRNIDCDNIYPNNIIAGGLTSPDANITNVLTTDTINNADIITTFSLKTNSIEPQTTTSDVNLFNTLTANLNVGNTGNIKVLEGTVQVSSNTGTGEPVEVNEGEKVSVLQGILSDVIPMTPEEIVSILSGRLFSGFTIPITPEGALYSVCSRLLPGFSCSTSGIPTPSIPTPPIPVPIPRFPF